MIETILARIVDNDALHEQWLNTLSYLEYVGARKIFKSQDENDVDDDMLMHMAEEIQHALFFRKIIVKYFRTSGRNYSIVHMLAKLAAKKYFQGIDALCNAFAQSRRHAYLLTSYIIESRALILYHHYEKVLQQRNLFRLTSIISQEQRHLRETKACIESLEKNFAEEEPLLRAQEQELFQEFLNVLTAEISHYESRAH